MNRNHRQLGDRYILSSKYLPTDEELGRGVALPAPRNWATSIYRENSLRMMTLGGTMTSDEHGYTETLEELILSGQWWPQDIPIPSHHSSIKTSHSNNPFPKSKDLSSSIPPTTKSYLWNEGINNTNSLPFNMKYRFEDWPTSQWPNLVTLEYTLECNGCVYIISNNLYNIFN